MSVPGHKGLPYHFFLDLCDNFLDLEDLLFLPNDGDLGLGGADGGHVDPHAVLGRPFVDVALVAANNEGMVELGHVYHLIRLLALKIIN